MSTNAAGLVVPIPTGPEDGNEFCAPKLDAKKGMARAKSHGRTPANASIFRVWNKPAKNRLKSPINEKPAKSFVNVLF
jgi:hypothetical protein